MNCWHCNTELIWGSDHDISEEDGYTFNGMVSNLSCPNPNCNSHVEVYFPIERIDDEDQH